MGSVSAEWPGPGVPKVTTSSSTHIQFESESTLLIGKGSVVLKGGFPLHVARCQPITGTKAIFEDGHGGECWEQREQTKRPLARELYLSV